MSRVLALLIALLWPVAAYAISANERLPDAGQEQRAREISAGLRCLVCQNQSIDDSEAPLAKDLRTLVRERIKAGDSNAQVLSFVVARYGEYVLLKPPFGWHTALLWLGPFMVVAAGAFGLWRLRKRHASASLGQKLSPDEEAELRRVLGQG